MAPPELIDAAEPGGPAEDEAEPEEREPFGRSRDLLGRATSPIRRHLDKLFSAIVKGFEDQAERSDDLDKWWNIYHCILDDEQFYQGNACVYVPIIRDAVNARTTRFANQLFPATGRYIDCTTSDGTQPFEIIALANHYISTAKLKTQVVKPMLRNGDIEGQYNLYIDWCEFRRQIVSRETKPPMQEVMGLQVEVPDEDPEPDIVEKNIAEGRPIFEVLHDSDVLILPASADSPEHALQIGGSVTIVRRWSDEKIEAMEDAGEIRSDCVEALKASKDATPNNPGLSDLAKQLIKAVGIRSKGSHAMALETWTMLPLNDKGAFAKEGKKRLCRAWFGVNRDQLGAKRNPFWNDRCPLLSAAQEKIAGVAKGKSPIEALAPVQYEANDAANERADVDHYGAMPIIADGRDGGTTNAPLILNLAAVWKVKPGDIQFMEFPDLSPRAKARIMDAYQIIFQSLGVNPSMLPQQTSGSKRNQAQVAQEQQVDLLTTAEAVSVVAETILDPLAAWIVDLDHQFRDRDLTVRMYGELGIKAEMIDVPPLQNRTRYQFQWCGAEQAKLNMAMQQQGTALLNVARGMAQQLTAEGIELRIHPAIERAFGNVFGPQTAALMLVDMRRNLTVPADLEDRLLAEGHAVPVHPLDNDAEHLMSHTRLEQETGDPHGNIRVHKADHIKQLTAKNQAMVQAQAGGAMGMGAPGVPGGAGPGVAGTPRPQGRPGMPQPGAVPGQPHALKQAPGAVHPDQMPRQGGGVVPMPRRM